MLHNKEMVDIEYVSFHFFQFDIDYFSLLCTWTEAAPITRCSHKPDLQVFGRD